MSSKTALLVIAALLSAAPVIAAPFEGLTFELAGGPVLGLDRPFRGGRLAAGFGLELGQVLGRSAEAFEAGLRAALSYDAGLEGLIAGADLFVGLGPDLRFLVGGELPLGALVLTAGDTRAPLAVARWPNRFGFAATIAEIGGDREVRRAPRFLVEAELSWSAYRLVLAGDATPGGDASPPAEIASGIAGFAAGFRACLGARLRW